MNKNQSIKRRPRKTYKPYNFHLSCKKKCKIKIKKIVEQNKKYKTIHKIASFFGKNNYADIELNNILDSKEMQNNKVFTRCIKECKKNRITRKIKIN